MNDAPRGRLVSALLTAVAVAYLGSVFLLAVGSRLPASALGTADVVVVPALAVGRDGTRLGRGGGYYDRALAHARPDAVLVAVLFDDELLDGVPAGAHDRRMTAVVTPAAGWEQLD